MIVLYYRDWFMYGSGEPRYVVIYDCKPSSFLHMLGGDSHISWWIVPGTMECD